MRVTSLLFFLFALALSLPKCTLRSLWLLSLFPVIQHKTLLCDTFVHSYRGYRVIAKQLYRGMVANEVFLLSSYMIKL